MQKIKETWLFYYMYVLFLLLWWRELTRATSNANSFTMHCFVVVVMKVTKRKQRKQHCRSSKSHHLNPPKKFWPETCPTCSVKNCPPKIRWQNVGGGRRACCSVCVCAFSLRVLAVSISCMWWLCVHVCWLCVCMCRLCVCAVVCVCVRMSRPMRTAHVTSNSHLLLFVKR